MNLANNNDFIKTWIYYYNKTKQGIAVCKFYEIYWLSYTRNKMTDILDGICGLIVAWKLFYFDWNFILVKL